MGEINIPRDQQDALAAIDVGELDRLIERAIREESSDLRRLPLAGCGSYIATQLHYFERALAKHREAKSARKRAETEDALQRAGRDLSFAVRVVKQRMKTEQEEGQLFFVDDQIPPPYSFSRHLTVRVSYRWRRTVDDQWTFGSIAFTHDVADLIPDFTTSPPRRKPSTAKQKQDLQNRLSRAWEHLMSGALYSVRDYFRDGGDGDKIPDTFQATVDSQRQLNNFSTQFWRQQV